MALICNKLSAVLSAVSLFCIMLQNYTKLFIHRSVLIPVPGKNAPEFINTLSTVKKLRKWLKAVYEGSFSQVLEIGSEHPFWDIFLTQHHHIIAGGGWVKNASGELLIIERNGKIDMPKGKLDPDETIETCAVREVKEECRVKRLKITGPAVKTYHCYPYKGDYALKTTFWYPMTTEYEKKLKPQIEEGITAVYWATSEMLRERMEVMPVYNSLEDELRRFARYSEE